tara:strand:+ start:4516 stop:5253 length:738 start_codon:yes stop_codon:yes gene_type:complete
MQAKIEKFKKDSKYHSDSLKYWNREAGVKRRSQSLTRALSRTKSDAHSKALWTLGKGRLAQEGIYKQKAKISRYSDKTGVARSNRYNVAKYKAILDKQKQIESTINNTFGRNMDIANQMISRNHQMHVAKNRASLGARPEYGAPVMMPPRDTQGQFFNSLSMGLGIASGVMGLSDIRAKENIEEVGKSPQGYKIFEWNYKSIPNKRYRGVIAQDVVKINPMAVDIRDNYLVVDYSKVDVDMEVVA